MASMTRSFFSLTSTSVEPPTVMTAIAPASLATLCSFTSLSYPVSETLICSLRSSSLFFRPSLAPAPPRMMVLFLSTITLSACPSSLISTDSRSLPSSFRIGCPPTKEAISCNSSILPSPKEGACTATRLKTFLSLLTTKVARASSTTSPAKITRSLTPTLCNFSKKGKSS